MKNIFNNVFAEFKQLHPIIYERIVGCNCCKLLFVEHSTKFSNSVFENSEKIVSFMEILDDG